MADFHYLQGEPQKIPEVEAGHIYFYFRFGEAQFTPFVPLVLFQARHIVQVGG